jgi:branched-subunit amino acid transport protein
VNAILAMLLLAAACWLLRVSLIVIVPAHRLPAILRRALGHLAPSVLAALVAVETQSAAGTGSTLDTAYVVGAVLVMGLVTWRTASLLWTVAVATAAAVLLDLVLV